jgi:hypothetical protein
MGNRRGVTPGGERAGGDDPRDSVVALGWCADVEAGNERSGDLVGKERAECATVETLDDLAEQVPVGVGVVIIGRRYRVPRRRRRGSCGERLDRAFWRARCRVIPAGEPA